MEKKLLVIADLRARGPAQTAAKIVNALTGCFNVYIAGYIDPLTRWMFFDTTVNFIDLADDTPPVLFNYCELSALNNGITNEIDPVLIKKISFLLEKINPTVVFSLGMNANPVLKFIKIKNPHLPLILYDALHPEGSFPKERLNIPRIKRLMEITYFENYPAANMVLLKQRKMGEYLEEKFQLRNTRYYGIEIDLNRYRQLVVAYDYILPSKECDWIVSVGSIQKRKNQVLLLQAFKICQHVNKAKLLFVGTGEDEEKLKMMAEEEKISDRVVFTGQCPTALPFIREADILVHTSYSEGIPNVICEAMALGTVTISTRWPGVEEIIEDGVTGFITGFDAGELATQIDGLLEDKTLRETIITNARSFIASYDYLEQKQTTIDLFNQFSQSKNSKKPSALITDHTRNIGGQSIALYGSGRLAEIFTTEFGSVVINNVYDGNGDKWGNWFYGKAVKEPVPEDLLQEKKIVVCSAYGWRAIVASLIGKGIDPESIYIYSL